MTEDEWRLREPVNAKLMNDDERPCLFGVAGPCVHPLCLEAHRKTLRAREAEQRP